MPKDIPGLSMFHLHFWSLTLASVLSVNNYASQVGHEDAAELHYVV